MKSIKLKIADKEIEFHFGLGFLGELLDNLDLSIEQLMNGIQKNPFKFLPKVMHGAASYAAQRKSEELGMTLYELIDLIDDDGGVASDNTSKFLQAFTASMTKDVPEESKTPKKVGKPKANRK